jgi:hypothetical protein
MGSETVASTSGGGYSWPAPGRPLWVDAHVHPAECARFRSYVVCGPDERDCAIWTGGIGADGYGRFFVTREGRGFCVRPNRYALALAAGTPLAADVLALHEWDNPICVKVCVPGAEVQHVVAGTQQDNMLRMGRARRGGGRPTIARRDCGREARRARSVALREAVRHGWDSAAVETALLGSQPRLF